VESTIVHFRVHRPRRVDRSQPRRERQQHRVLILVHLEQQMHMLKDGVPDLVGRDGCEQLRGELTESGIRPGRVHRGGGRDGKDGSALVLNSGDAGFLRSLDTLSASEASRSVNDGATIAAHAQHVRYGFSLMNRFATEGGNPFADARWDEAWKVSAVDAAGWKEIRDGLRDETHRWFQALGSPREASVAELSGLVASIAHLAYHLGAIRQIGKGARGPKEGTFR